MDNNSELNLYGCQSRESEHNQYNLNSQSIEDFEQIQNNNYNNEHSNQQLQDNNQVFQNDAIEEQKQQKDDLINEIPIKIYEQGFIVNSNSEDDFLSLKYIYIGENKDKVDLVLDMRNKQQYQFYIRKIFYDQQLYNTEKENNVVLLKRSEEKDQIDFRKFCILQENIGIKQYNMEIYYHYGYCSLEELAQEYKKKKKILPLDLIFLVFKVISQAIQSFEIIGQYHTDIKPQNIVMEYDKEANKKMNSDIYNLKLIDFGSLSDSLSIKGGYTHAFYDSELFLKYKEYNTFNCKEERLWNEFYTLFRTLQAIMLDNSEESANLFKQPQSHQNLQLINNKIRQMYISECESNPKLNQIMKFMDEFILGLVEVMTNDIQSTINRVEQKVKEINQQINDIEQYKDQDKIIKEIACDKIRQRQTLNNPLEMILTINCKIELQCQKYLKTLETQEVSQKQESQERKVLEKTLDEFINNENKHAFILFGKAGAGKTTFLQMHYQKNKKQYFQQKDSLNKQYWPFIFIDSQSFSQTNKKQSYEQQINDFFQKTSISEQQIIYFDGYDEFGKDREKILKNIQISEYPKIKIIISCRTNEISEAELQSIFPKQIEKQQIELYHISPVDQIQIESYIPKFIETIQNYKQKLFFEQFECLQKAEEYKEIMKQFPSLKEMATEPLIIRMILGIIPQIKKTQFNQITSFSIIQLFIELWVENEQQRRQNDQDLQNILQKIKEKNIIRKVFYWIFPLIQNLWVDQKISKNIISSSDITQAQLEPLETDKIISLLPIIYNKEEKQYTFIHKTFLDFILGLLWKKDFETDNQQNSEKNIVENNKNSSQNTILMDEIQNLSISKQFIRKDTYPSLTMLTDYINSQSIIDTETLEQKANIYIQTVRICFFVLMSSKKKEFQYLEASSNAFTILNFINFSFSGLDLSGIKVKYSNLDCGVFIGTNFKSAQLEECIFTRSNLNNCNFQKANLDEVNFGIEYPSLIRHKQIVSTVAIDKSGSYIASGSYDKTVKVWDFKTKKELITLLHNNCVMTVDIFVSEQSKYIASGMLDKSVIIWDFEKGEKLWTLKGHTNQLRSVVISPDGKYVVSGSKDENILSWNLKTGELYKTFKGHKGGATSIAISQDCTQMVVGVGDNTIKVWNFITEQVTNSLLGHIHLAVTCVALSKNCEYIVSGSSDFTIKIWDCQTGQEIKTLQGHKNWLYSVAISEDNKYIVSGSKDSTIKIWNLKLGIIIQTLFIHSDHVRQVVISPDNKYIISGSVDRTVKISNLPSQEQTFERKFRGHKDIVTSVAISRDGKYFVSASNDYTIKIWNFEKQSECTTLYGHGYYVSSVVISDDSKYVISGSGDSTVKIWDLKAGIEIKTLKGHTDHINSVAISSKYVVSGSKDKTIKVWNLVEGTVNKTLNQHTESVLSVALSTDNEYIVSGSVDKTIIIWNFSNEQVIKTLKCHQDSVTTVAIFVSDKQKYIVSGSKDKTIIISDLESGHQIFTFAGEKAHQKQVNSVYLSYDGKYLVSGSNDMTIKIWSLEKYELIRTITGCKGQIISVALSANCKYIVSGSKDHSVKVWFFREETIVENQKELNSISQNSNGSLIMKLPKPYTNEIFRSESGIQQLEFKGINIIDSSNQKNNQLKIIQQELDQAK